MLPSAAANVSWCLRQLDAVVLDVPSRDSEVKSEQGRLETPVLQAGGKLAQVLPGGLGGGKKGDIHIKIRTLREDTQVKIIILG